jgi:hypothetical protein
MLKLKVMSKDKDEFEVDFLDTKRAKELDDKVKSGEITCNLDSPEECENCGS